MNTNSEDQFEAMVRDHYESLFRFAIRLTRAECDAKDLTQQTFYVWATKGHQLRDLSKARTWLFTTLHNAFLKERRKQTKFIHEDLETVADQLPAFRSQAGHSGDFCEVRSALTRVDEIYRGAVALFYLNDCSYLEIVDILKVPLGTVKSRIARGIAQLRQILLFDDSAHDVSLSPPESAQNAEPLNYLPERPCPQAQWVAEIFEHGARDRGLSSTLLPGTT